MNLGRPLLDEEALEMLALGNEVTWLQITESGYGRACEVERHSKLLANHGLRAVLFWP